MAWLGEAGRGEAGRGMANTLHLYGGAAVCQGWAWRGWARQGAAGLGPARQGMARQTHGAPRSAAACQCKKTKN